MLVLIKITHYSNEPLLWFEGLVLKKNLSQKYGSLGWRTGPDKLAKISKTCPHCDVSFRKPKIEKEKKFLTCSLRLAESVEGLNSSLAQSSGDL